MVLFGIFQFGIAFNNYITVTHAAREGARLASVDLENEDIENIIIQRSYPITPEEITIVTPLGEKIGDPVEVTVKYTVNINIPLVGSWNVPLTSKAVMRLENYSF
jgi:Flp pilus assembly protein TadG